MSAVIAGGCLPAHQPTLLEHPHEHRRRRALGDCGRRRRRHARTLRNGRRTAGEQQRDRCPALHRGAIASLAICGGGIGLLPRDAPVAQVLERDPRARSPRRRHDRRGSARESRSPYSGAAPGGRCWTSALTVFRSEQARAVRRGLRIIGFGARPLNPRIDRAVAEVERQRARAPRRSAPRQRLAAEPRRDAGIAALEHLVGVERLDQSPRRIEPRLRPLVRARSSMAGRSAPPARSSCARASVDAAFERRDRAAAPASSARWRCGPSSASRLGSRRDKRVQPLAAALDVAARTALGALALGCDRSGADRRAPAPRSRPRRSASARAGRRRYRTASCRSRGPTAEMIGIEQSATARTTTSSLNAHRSSIEPPPRATITRSGRGTGPSAGSASNPRTAAATFGRGAVALHLHRPDQHVRRAAIARAGGGCRGSPRRSAR